MRKFALVAFGLVVASLVALGLVVLSSASEANAIRMPMCHGDVYYFLKRQAAFALVGCVAAFVVAKFDYHHWRDQPWMAFAMALIVFGLLWAVFLFPATKGSHRWLPVGPVRLQPSEFAKLVVVIWMAMWLDRSGWKIELFVRGALIPCCFLGLMALPVVLEPDFGSTTVMLAAGCLVMVVAGVKIMHALPFIGAGMAAVATLVALNPNRMARIAAFLGYQLETGANVSAGATEAAEYQAYNALVAISNGGLWGVGLNQSMQKHYYLPEAHTDFILAIGAEELGLLFSIAVLILFSAFFALSVYIARNASDRFGRYLVVGMAFLIFGQAMANVGVVCEAFPTKGLALPFFSYGGTNLISAFIAVGTILSVGLHSSRDRKR